MGEDNAIADEPNQVRVEKSAGVVDMADDEFGRDTPQAAIAKASSSTPPSKTRSSRPARPAAATCWIDIGAVEGEQFWPSRITTAWYRRSEGGRSWRTGDEELVEGVPFRDQAGINERGADIIRVAAN